MNYENNPPERKTKLRRGGGRGISPLYAMVRDVDGKIIRHFHLQRSVLDQSTPNLFALRRSQAEVAELIKRTRKYNSTHDGLGLKAPDILFPEQIGAE